MEKPLVSICIPAYNNEATIRQTVDSVLNQTYENIELILVDDCSKDNTVLVLKDISDARFKIVENEKNLGMSGNWNKALSLCEGKYIKLLCGDDILHETLVEREVEALENNPSAVMVSTDTVFIDESGKEVGKYNRYKKSGLVNGKEICRFSVFTRDYLGAPLANLFRKDAYESCGGFDPEFSYIVDYDFYMTLACAGDIYIIHEPLNYFRLRRGSNTSEVLGGEGKESYIAEHRHLVEKHANSLGLGKTAINLSVFIRRLSNRAGSVYLRLFVPKEK